MRNLLLSEYEIEAAKVAAQFGADLPLSGRSDPHWTAPLGMLSVSIHPQNVAGQRGGERHLIPEARIGSSRGLPSDTATALVVLADAQATIVRAMSALILLGPVRVWVDDAPCDYCGGKGNDRGTPCARCEGKGTRAEVTA